MQKVIKAVIISLIIFYRKWISPMKPATCRFYPSCSCYTLQAVRKYGVCKGLSLAMRRLCRCHPFHRGGYDPLP